MKKLWIILIAFALMVGAVMLIPHHAKAAKEDWFTYEIVDGEAIITYCNSSAPSELVIPSTLGGYPVTSIGGQAFYFDRHLTSVVIQDGVTSIGHGAFFGCDSLTSVVIPDSVTSIDESAFSHCSSLRSVVIGEGLTSISDSAFYNCKSFKEINVSENNVAYCSDNGVMFNKTKSVIICYPAGKTEKSYKIPDSVTSIGDGAFQFCSSLTSIEIPDSVMSIGNHAFSNCESLTSIEIPDNVTSIGHGAFEFCTHLTSIEIPLSVTIIGDSVSYFCSSLTTVYYTGTGEDWNKISIGSNNFRLLEAEIVFAAEKSELEKALDGTGLTVGKLANETEVVIVPTVSGNVAMTEAELAEMLGDDITIVSNNGIIGTGSKIIIGEQEVEIVVKGDIDGDGIATVFDALMVKKALAENSFTEKDIREFAGDIDGEGTTDTADVDAILAHIVGEMLIA